jgi:hypothetical protein
VQRLWGRTDLGVFRTSREGVWLVQEEVIDEVGHLSKDLVLEGLRTP